MKNILIIMLGILFGIVFGVNAEYILNSKNIEFKPKDSTWNINNVEEAIGSIKESISDKGEVVFLGNIKGSLTINNSMDYSELYAFSYYINGYSYGDLPNYRFTHSNITSIDNATFSLEHSYDSTKSVLRLYKIIPNDNVLTFHIESGLPDQLVLIGIKK